MWSVCRCVMKTRFRLGRRQGGNPVPGRGGRPADHSRARVHQVGLLPDPPPRPPARTGPGRRSAFPVPRITSRVAGSWARTAVEPGRMAGASSSAGSVAATKARQGASARRRWFMEGGSWRRGGLGWMALHAGRGPLASPVPGARAPTHDGSRWRVATTASRVRRAPNGTFSAPAAPHPICRSAARPSHFPHWRPAVRSIDLSACPNFRRFACTCTRSTPASPGSRSSASGSARHRCSRPTIPPSRSSWGSECAPSGASASGSRCTWTTIFTR